jgi:hypothetical protein
MLTQPLVQSMTPLVEQLLSSTPKDLFILWAIATELFQVLTIICIDKFYIYRIHNAYLFRNVDIKATDAGSCG